jgi:thiamine biosynthesis protein ThiI
VPEFPAPQGPDEPCVLLKLGEIVLKGRNRQQFERILHGNIRVAVAGLGLPVDLRQREGVILLRVADGEQRGEAGWAQAVGQIAERMRDVPGIARVCLPLRVAKTPEAISAAAMALTKGTSGTFAVRARRRDKRFPLTSGQLGVLIGREIQEAHGLGVNLSEPDITVFIEVDQDEVFVFTEGMAGQGGLPVGMSGRGIVLMSGGIDSPVAAYRMMRRGLRCFFLHFSGMPLTGPESIYKAYALARGLDRFQGGSRLFVVPFGKAQQALKSSGADRLLIVAQRRLMLKTGEALARRLSATALITGDSLGQVSSQTLTNITALDDAVTLPILRPLIGWDKTEIMAEARRIRTLAISELPDQDCCTLLTPRRVETRARIDDLRRIEIRLDAGDLAEELAASAHEYRQEARGNPLSRTDRVRAPATLPARSGQGGLAGNRGGRGKGAADQRGEVSGHAGQLAQVGLDQRLRAVAQRRLRVRVDVHDDAVGADRDRGPGQRQDQVPAAAGMRRVHDHRQVRQPLRDRDRADVQGVPGGLLERADAALAEHDVQVAALSDVFGGHQPFLDGGVHAALEHDRLAHAADRLQQREVLHVARADLEHVRVAGDQVHVAGVDHLGHHRQAGRLAHLGEDLQPGLAQPLERVR